MNMHSGGMLYELLRPVGPASGEHLGFRNCLQAQGDRFLKKFEDFSIFVPTAILGVADRDFERPRTFSTEHGLRREYHHSTDLTLLYPEKN